MKNLKNFGSVEPSAFITINKQRVKQYQDILYLKNGQEFEIELFNPHQIKVLATIEFNGQSIGNGVVLNPGQRIYLERYLNVPKKFLFETYEINSKDKRAVEATLKNGKVKISFYKEFFFNNSSVTHSIIYDQPIVFTPIEHIYGSGLSGSINDYTYTTSITSMNNLDGCTTTCSNFNLDFQETGRVEKGSQSNQKFTVDQSQFDYFPCDVIEWTILPESRKVLNSTDLIVYCSNCGSKRKKQSYKFCPHCGTKF